MTAARCPERGANRGLKTFGRAREGGVAVVVALSIGVLVGSAALALDLGRLYNAVTELDNAADAAALAAASQLIGTPNTCARAIAAATNVNLQNTEIFADNSVGPPVFIDNQAWPTNTNIRFLTKLVKDVNGKIIGDYIDTDDVLPVAEEPDVASTDPTVCDAQANFVEVTVDRHSPSDGDLYTVVFDFAQLVGAVGEAHPRGYAVAGIGRFFCGSTPMFMCEITETSLTNPPAPNGIPTGTMTFDDLLSDPDEYRGRGMIMKAAGPQNTQWDSGLFGFLQLDYGGGTPGLECAIGMADPGLTCIGLESLEALPGNHSGARDKFNTRFGFYEGNFSNPSNPQWQPSANNMSGWLRRGNQCGTGPKGWVDPGKKHDPADPEELWSYKELYDRDSGSIDLSNLPKNIGTGYPKDDCVYGSLPSGDCGGQDANNTDRLGSGVWDVETYLGVNHDRLRTALSNDYLRTDSGGSVNPAGSFEEALRWDNNFMGVGRYAGEITRFMVYQWEMGFCAGDCTTGYSPAMYGKVSADPLMHTIADNIIDPNTSAVFTLGPGGVQLLPAPLVAQPPIMPDPPHDREFGGPHNQCYSGSMGQGLPAQDCDGNDVTIDMVVDRRVIEVVMVDCEAELNCDGCSNKDFDGEGFVQMFILGPWAIDGAGNSAKHEIYAEIIGPVTKDIEKKRAAEIVQLYE